MNQVTVKFKNEPNVNEQKIKNNDNSDSNNQKKKTQNKSDNLWWETILLILSDKPKIEKYETKTIIEKRDVIIWGIFIAVIESEEIKEKENMNICNGIWCSLYFPIR